MSLRQRLGCVYLRDAGVGIRFSVQVCLDAARILKLDRLFPRTLAVFRVFVPEILSNHKCIVLILLLQQCTVIQSRLQQPND